MAVGNAIVNTARFKPLTVAEWAAPLKEYAAQQEATQQALMQLSADADEYERYIQENPKDPISTKYRQYLADIDKQVNDLTQYGMTPQSRSNLMTLFRDYNKAIKPVKTGVTAYQAYQKNLINKDDGTLLGNPLTVQDFIENPDRPYTFTKGSDIQKEATTAAAAMAKSRKQRGVPTLTMGGQYFQITDQTGYSPQELQSWMNGEASFPELDKIVDSIKAKHGNISEEEIKPYILRGIQDGVSATYDVKYDTKTNLGYGKTSSGSGSGSGRKGSGKETPEDILYKRFRSQSRPSPDYNSEAGVVSPEAAQRIIAGPQPNKPVFTMYDQNPGIFVQPQTPTVIPGTNIPVAFRTNTDNFIPYREVGVLQASAEFYNRNNQNKSGYSTLAQKAQALNDALGLTERKKTHKNTLLIDDRKLKNLGTYAQAYFGKYRNYDEIPEDAKMLLVKRITAAGGENNLVGWGNKIKNDPQLIEMLAQMGWDEMSSTTPTIVPTANNTNVLPRSEYEVLRKAGVKFQNADGTPRSNEEILWDAWDLLPKQYQKQRITSTIGAGANYRKTATEDYFDEFPNGGKVVTRNGDKITLTPSTTESGTSAFEGYSSPDYYLTSDLLRKGKKLLVLNKGDKHHEVEIPLSQHERALINDQVNEARANILVNLVMNGAMSEAKADELSALDPLDFIKYVEMHANELGYNANRLTQGLVNAILKDNEENFIPQNSETQGTYYNYWE